MRAHKVSLSYSLRGLHNVFELGCVPVVRFKRKQETSKGRYDLMKFITTHGKRLRCELKNFPWQAHFLSSRILIVCMNNNKLIGACGIKGPANYLGIYVKEKYRGKGIARKLLETTISVVRDTDLDFITLIVSSSNFRALHLYNKIGFKEIVRYYDRKHGEDNLIMMLSQSSKYHLIRFLLHKISCILPKKFLSHMMELPMIIFRARIK